MIDKISLKRQNIGSIWYIHSIHFIFSRRILQKVPQSVVFEQNFHKPFVDLSFGNFKLNIAELQKLNTATYLCIYLYFLVFQDYQDLLSFFIPMKLKRNVLKLHSQFCPGICWMLIDDYSFVEMSKKGHKGWFLHHIVR